MEAIGFAIIGCEVTGKTQRDVFEPGCVHVVPLEEYNFCPECGRPRLVKRTIDLTFTPEFEALAEVGITFAFTADRQRAFAGVTSKTDTDNVPVVVPCDFAAVRDVVHDALEPLGLWNESSFGLLCVVTQPLYYGLR